MKRLKPLNDIIFKKIFGEKVNKEILISFLNSILSSEVKDVEIQEEKLQRDKIDDKLGILDIKATLDTGEKVNIEVQQLNQYNMIKRTLYYWSKLYTENFKTKEKYNQLRKTITINIVGFKLFKANESFYSSYHIYEDKTFQKLNDDLEIHFIELTKFQKVQKDLHNPLHRWLLFLQEDIETYILEEIVMMDEVIRTAEEKLAYLSSDEETRRLYELREKQIRDEATRISGAKKEGQKVGEHKKAIEIAQKMINKGKTIEEIQEFTELDKEIIIRLKAEEGE